VRRHPILLTLAGLLLVAGALLYWLVASFDLDSYRSELQDSLSTALGQPVHLGRVHLSLRHGPALDVRAVEVGGGNQDSSLQIRHLFLRLDLDALLHRRLQTRNLLLDQPVLTLVRSAPPASGAASSLPPKLDPQLLERLGFRDCTLHDGRLRLIDRSRPDKVMTLELADLNGRLSNLAPGQKGLLQLGGRIDFADRQADFVLTGDLLPGTDFPFWREARYNLRLTLNDLPAAWLSPVFFSRSDSWGLDGRTDVTASFTGQPSGGLDIGLTLSGAQLTLVSPNGHSSAPLFSTVGLHTRWLEQSAASLFEPLRLTIGNHLLSGKLEIKRQPSGPAIAALLEADDLPLPSWTDLFPEGSDARLNALRNRLSGGRLKQLQLTYHRQPAADAGAPADDFSLSAQAQEMRLALTPDDTIENLGGRLQVTPTALTVKAGHGDLAGNGLQFAGELPLTATASAHFSAEVQGEFGAGWLGARLAPDLPADLELTGILPLHGTLSGPLDHPQIDLHADLQPLQIRYRDLVEKPAGEAGELFLSGDAAAGQLTLTYGRLRLPPLEIMTNGSLALDADHAFRLDLRLAPLDLAALPKRVPILERLHPRGQLSGEYHLRGAAGQLREQTGTLNLNGAGLHLGGFIADLNELSGSLHLNQRQLAFTALTGRIGEAPFTASGSLSDLAAPAGTVHLQARAVRADDLIFHSDQSYLRDLDARLVIAPGRLEFAPVITRLDGGTHAEVRGSVSHFQGPVAVHLDIDADYGNIDEVIGLWQRSAAAPPLAIPPHHGPPPDLLIRAHAAKGEIGGMDFQDASAEISLADQTLVIHPLHAKIGPGFVDGQVLVDHAAGSPPLLRISGHAEDIAAEVVHQQLLKQSSLVKGRLRGDFYLEGRAGSEFLPTSLGGFNIEIRHGVLRQFKFLSKVFSLLNVAQIFSLKLPDMDREGMPFDKVSGTIRLDRGVLSSEDLFVESNAMNLSLIGKLNLIQHQLDVVMGVKPLRTVDKIITNIPLAGWLLAGKEKALITAQFTIKGQTSNPEVKPIPISSLSSQVLGIFRRVLGLPEKVVEDVGGILQGGK